ICIGGMHPVLQVPGTVASLAGLQERTTQAHLLDLKGFTKIAQQTILYMNGIYRGDGISVFRQLYVSQCSFAPEITRYVFNREFWNECIVHRRNNGTLYPPVYRSGHQRHAQAYHERNDSQKKKPRPSSCSFVGMWCRTSH